MKRVWSSSGAGRLMLKCAIWLLAGILCWRFVLCLAYVDGSGMFPAVRDGDLCAVYRPGAVVRNGVISYRDGKGAIRIGRVTGMPGDEIDFPKAGGYTVNGWRPSETITYQTFRADHSGLEYPATVPENCYFVMNDFRSDTSDSRESGFIRKKDIIGNVAFLVRRRGF